MADADEKTEARSLIDVDILGHIFEQSITDLERLRQSLMQTFHAPVAADGSRRILSADKMVNGPIIFAY